MVNPKSRTRRWIVLLAAVELLSLLGSSVAASGSPPRTYLRSGGERLQRGVLGSNCWGDLCSTYFNGYPRAVTVKTGSEERIRLWKKQKPSYLAISFYRRVDRRGEGRGDQEEIDYWLRPLRRDGETVAWQAIFQAEGTHHYYLDLFARWHENDSSWKFHFKTE